jgi:hypothetical protein
MWTALDRCGTAVDKADIRLSVTAWSVFVTVQEEDVVPSQAQGITVETQAKVCIWYSTVHLPRMHRVDGEHVETS